MLGATLARGGAAEEQSFRCFWWLHPSSQVRGLSGHMGLEGSQVSSLGTELEFQSCRLPPLRLSGLHLCVEGGPSLERKAHLNQPIPAGPVLGSIRSTLMEPLSGLAHGILIALGTFPTWRWVFPHWQAASHAALACPPVRRTAV